MDVDRVCVTPDKETLLHEIEVIRRLFGVQVHIEVHEETIVAFVRREKVGNVVEPPRRLHVVRFMFVLVIGERMFVRIIVTSARRWRRRILIDEERKVRFLQVPAKEEKPYIQIRCLTCTLHAYTTHYSSGRVHRSSLLSSLSLTYFGKWRRSL